MNIRNNQIFRSVISGMIICLLFVLTAVMTILGCSRRSTDPVVNINYPDSQYDLPLSSVVYFDGLSGSNIMAAYDLVISGDGSFADLVPVRDASIGESYIISGETIFTNFCRDCLQIRGIGLDINQDIKLEFFIKHPMKNGDPSLPPSANNRLDLDVFDVALNVQPVNTTPQTYDLTGVDLYSDTMTNPHGYTQELSQLIGDDAAIPFRMCYISDPEENNRFEMGSSSEFNVVLKSPGGSYRLYLTMNYGISADFHSRLYPQYYVPEFNKKAAWRIKVYCPKYLAEDTVHPNDIQINVFDWQMNHAVDPDFPDPLRDGCLSSPSKIESVTVEIPGMIDNIAQAVYTRRYFDTASVYKTSIANENGLPAGIYTGLVKVTDNRVAGTIPGFNSDSLMHTDDGGQSFSEYNIDEFATFQTFKVQVYDHSLNPSLAGMYYPMTGFDDFDFQGDYAYIENAPYGVFNIVNLSDPVRPKVVGSITDYEGIGWISGISVDGDIACVLDEQNRSRFLYVVDISDKAHPAIIGELEFNDSTPYAVEMMGNTVYVLHGSSIMQELTVVDITQPSAPGIISTWNMNYDCSSFIKIRGNYLFFGGLKILDISDPHDVQIVASLDLGCYENAAIHGDYFYYACEEEGLKIIDISDPTNPFVASVLDSMNAYDVVIGFNHAYVTSNSKDELYVKDELLIIDISNPLSPNQVNSLSGFENISNIAINGEYMYLREGGLRLYTLSIAQPDNPVIESSFDSLQDSCSVAANDHIALVCHSYGMHMFDITDKTNPTVIRYEKLWTAQAVELSGDIGYLLCGRDHFGIVDFTDPANPQELCSIKLAGPNDVIVKDNLAYIAGRHGLTILDVSDPANPITLFDDYNHCAGSVAIDIDNDRLYGVTQRWMSPYTLVITDISDPTNPVEEGWIDLGFIPEDIAVNGNYAYVAGGDECRIFDISDPMNPVSVSDIPVTHTKCVKIRDDFLYLGDVGQLEIYELVDPENPAMINSFEAIGFYSAFDLRENYAYCGDEIGGFAIVELW